MSVMTACRRETVTLDSAGLNKRSLLIKLKAKLTCDTQSNGYKDRLEGFNACFVVPLCSKLTHGKINEVYWKV